MFDLTIKDFIQFVVQGGVAIIVFVIWYFTFMKASKQTDKFLEQSLGQSDEAFKKLTTISQQLIQLLKDEQEYKLQIAGTMERMSINLEKPARCPLLIEGRKVKVEVIDS